MRAERLLSLMLLLRSQGQMTAGDLATSLDVSKRTIYRDVETLSLAGIPIYTIDGRGGGIGLDDSYRVSLAGLNMQEVQALFVSGSPAPLHELGLTSANETTLLKLLDALPSLHRAEAVRVRQRIHIDPTNWFASRSPTPFISQVQEAVLTDSVLRMVYQRTNGDTFERTIQAYGLVAKSSVWYLVGAHDNTFRTYRMSRIRELRTTDEQFTRQPDFDLAQFWQAHTQSFINNLPRYPVQIQIRQSRRDWVGGMLSLDIDDLSPSDEPDWLEATVPFDTQEQALAGLLPIAKDIRILSPPDLYNALHQFARDVLDTLDDKSN